jgi:hypothetical protein
MKDSEKFHPIDRRDFTSGWTNTTVKFNVISGTNRVMVQTQGGKWKDDKKNVVKTMSKTITDDNGNVIKGEQIDIPWNKRFDSDEIDKVAGHRKFTVDTGDVKMRYKLMDAVKAFEDGTITDEMMNEVGVDELEDAKAALETSMAKKKVFLSAYDFAEYMVKVVRSDKLKNALFAISGTYDVNYSEEKGRFYITYNVNKVTRVADDTVPKTELKINFYFSEDAFNDDVYDEKGISYLNGWTDYYDNNLKTTGFMPMTIAVRENEKANAIIKRKFDVDCDDAVKTIGITLSVVDGAERVELTVDMMTDEEKEEYEAGLLDFEDWKRSKGGNAYGDRVSEIRFDKFTAGKSAVEDTTYTINDMHPARVAKKVEEDKAALPFDVDDDDL